MRDYSGAFVALWGQLTACRGLSEPVREYRFHPTRKWRFDVAFPDVLVCVEIEGMTPAGGRHQRWGGFRNDVEKYREAALLGWTVLRYTGDDLRTRPVQVVEEVAGFVRRKGAGDGLCCEE